MACEIRPPVTLWGTTQVTSLATILSTPAGGANADIETITRETIVTNVIPVETRSYPCTSSSPSPSISSSSSTSTSTSSRSAVNTPSSTNAASETRSESDPLTISATRPRPSVTPSSSSSESISVSADEITESPLEPSSSSLEVGIESTPPHLGSHPASIEISASSVFTDTDPLTSMPAGGDSKSSTTDPSGLSTSVIAGIVTGVIIFLLLLVLLLLKWRWTRKRSLQDGEGSKDPYWERRFEELESRPKLELSRAELPLSPSEAEGTWRKHLTLNLGSHHSVIARPASRLSQISSFFGQEQRSPEPNLLATTAPGGGGESEEIDFSHPASDKWSTGSGTGPGGRGRPSSFKSSRSRTSAKSRNGSTSGRRISAWPFGTLTGLIQRNSVQSARITNTQRQGADSSEARRGMEWIRTIVGSDSGFGFNLDPNRSPSLRRTPTGRGLPPPPRSRGVSPMPLRPVNTTTTPDGGGGSETNSAVSPNPISPNPPPSYESQGESTLSPREPSQGARQLYPSNSLRRKRVNMGLAVPDLSLSRDATSPNLWVDGDTLDSDPDSDLRRVAEQHREIPEVLPPVPPVPSVAPLAISKRNVGGVGHTQVPPKPAPSAYNPPTHAIGHGLYPVSRFSPDSSRASFSTIGDDSRQSVPAPAPAPGRDNRERENDGDSIATRRYDRSAVTPQLPTLAISNADAFRAEMAEVSASNSAGDDREERVISFHGGKVSKSKGW